MERDWIVYEIKEANFIKDTHITLVDFRFHNFKRKIQLANNNLKQDKLNLYRE